MRAALWILLPALLAAAPRESAKPVVVIAHRGEHLRHPENTLPAFRAAIDIGADFIEVDVRTTADGRLVLMHDASVDARTDGHGQVSTLTFEEIRRLDAGIRMGKEFAGTRVPTFEEVLELARGRIGVYVDCKAISAEDLVAALEKARMASASVIYGGAQLLERVAALRPALRVMPEANNAAVLRRLIEALHLRVAAFDARDFNDETIAVARAAGVEIYVDRLGPADTESSWQDAVDRGAAGIQTDHPAELLAFLRSKGQHR
jgi:glycerophosphoryl diester phosphodiesterase